MKKNILGLLLVIVLGIFCGKVLYDKVNDVYAFNKHHDKIVYFLQLGVYSSKESMESDTVHVSNKLVMRKGNNYYVYIGISRKKENLEKISTIYHELGYNLYLFEEEIENEDFLANLEQFDVLLGGATTNDEIDSINSVILSSYEEMVLKK